MGRFEKMNNSVKSLLFTSLFCIIIAFATQSIWPSALIEHLVISFGFGYSAVFSAHLISWVKPDFSLRLVNLYSLIAAMIFGTCNAYFWLNKYQDFSTVQDMKSIVFLGFLFTGACFFYFYAHEQKLIAQKELEKAKRKQSEQDKALLLSQLRQLQSQIEPHFLFNTLANVSALIEHEPKSAQRMLEKLTELLRGTLTNSRGDNSTLSGELALIHAYLEIQKIRLADRLDFQIENQLTGERTLPPMVLQPLVENAIQHGIEPKVAGGSIYVRTCEKAGQLVITIEDSGVGLGQESSHVGHGVGIANTKQRLTGLYGDKASLSISELTSGGVRAQIRLPSMQINEG
jgi:sensor histidine kinase YesM